MIWRDVANHCQHSVLQCSFAVANLCLEGFEVALGHTGEGRYAYLPFGGETGLQSLFEDHALSCQVER